MTKPAIGSRPNFGTGGGFKAASKPAISSSTGGYVPTAISSQVIAKPMTVSPDLKKQDNKPNKAKDEDSMDEDIPEGNNGSESGDYNDDFEDNSKTPKDKEESY
jgi:hypothetical protein